MSNDFGADPVADALAALNEENLANDLRVEGHQIGLRLSAIRTRTIREALKTAVEPWIAVWEKFAAALAENQIDGAVAAVRDASAVLQRVHSSWSEWQSARAHWYETEAEPWHRKIEPYRALHRILRYVPRFTPPHYEAGREEPSVEEPEGHEVLEHLPDGPASAPRLIREASLFEQFVLGWGGVPGREIQAVLLSVERPDMAGKLLASIRNQRGRVAAASMAIAATILPARSVLSRVVEMASSEQAKSDSRLLLKCVPDCLCTKEGRRVAEKFDRLAPSTSASHEAKSVRDVAPIVGLSLTSYPVDLAPGARNENESRTKTVGHTSTGDRNEPVPDWSHPLLVSEWAVEVFDCDRGTASRRLKEMRDNSRPASNGWHWSINLSAFPEWLAAYEKYMRKKAIQKREDESSPGGKKQRKQNQQGKK